MESDNPKPLIKYKAYIVLGRKQYQTRIVFNEIPESVKVHDKTYKLKLVLWNCNNKATLDTHKFIELQALIYR